MIDRISKKLISILLCALFAAAALLTPAQALARKFDPNASLSDFIYDLDCEQLDVIQDTNGFTHTRNNFYTKYEMDAAYQNVLFSLVQTPTDYAKLVKRLEKKWQGSCYGMTCTMTLSYYSRKSGYPAGKGLSLSDLQPGAQSYSQISAPLNNRRALNWINFYQCSHSVSASLQNATTRAALLRYSNGKRRFSTAQLKELVARVKGYVDNDLPFAFAYSYPTKDKNGDIVTSSHAIPGCDYYLDRNTNYFYIKFYDENDLGSHRVGKTIPDPHFCYIRLKYDPSTGNYSAPYKDTAGNDVIKIFYFNYKHNKPVGKTINSMTVYNMYGVYNNVKDKLAAAGLRTASGNLSYNDMNSLSTSAALQNAAPGDAVLTINGVNDIYAAYGIEPFIYDGGNVNRTLPADSCGKLFKPAALALDQPYVDTELDEVFEEESSLPLPVDAENHNLPFAHMPSPNIDPSLSPVQCQDGYEYQYEDDSDNVNLAITLKPQGKVNGSDSTFDGYDFTISDGVLPGVSLAKGSKYAWVSGEGVEYVRFSSDGRLRDVIGDGEEDSEMEMYFGTLGEPINLDMFSFGMRGLDFLQVYDTEDDEDFDDCIVLRTNSLAEGFYFNFYKGALESGEYEGVVEPEPHPNDNREYDVWIKIQAFSDGGQLGVSVWTVEDLRESEFIPDFPETPEFTTRLRERGSASSGGTSAVSTYDESTTQYALKGGAQGEALPDGSLRFTIDAPFEKHTGATVDGKPLQKGVDYDVNAGSTIITLKRDFLAALKDGTHTLDVYFKDGKCTTTFTTPLGIAATPVAQVPATGGVSVGGALCLLLSAAALCSARRRRRA